METLLNSLRDPPKIATPEERLFVWMDKIRTAYSNVDEWMKTANNQKCDDVFWGVIRFCALRYSEFFRYEFTSCNYRLSSGDALYIVMYNVETSRCNNGERCATCWDAAVHAPPIAGLSLPPHCASWLCPVTQYHLHAFIRRMAARWHCWLPLGEPSPGRRVDTMVAYAKFATHALSHFVASNGFGLMLDDDESALNGETVTQEFVADCTCRIAAIWRGLSMIGMLSRTHSAPLNWIDVLDIHPTSCNVITTRVKHIATRMKIYIVDFIKRMVTSEVLDRLLNQDVRPFTLIPGDVELNCRQTRRVWVDQDRAANSIIARSWTSSTTSWWLRLIDTPANLLVEPHEVGPICATLITFATFSRDSLSRCNFNFLKEAVRAEHHFPAPPPLNGVHCLLWSNHILIRFRDRIFATSCAFTALALWLLFMERENWIFTNFTTSVNIEALREHTM